MTLMKLDVEIDDEMVPLVKAMNDSGLKTQYCCAGHDDLKGARYVSISMKNIVRVSISRENGLRAEQLHIEWMPKKKETDVEQ